MREKLGAKEPYMNPRVFLKIFSHEGTTRMQTTLIIGVFALFFVISKATPPSYMDYESFDDDGERDEKGERIVYGIPAKRACVARGGNCDHRAAECCYSTACRCNLWGANCRCQRKGLFTKLG